MDLKESGIIGGSISQHWYFQSKAKAMMKLLRDRQISTILDVGAGSAFFSNYLLSHSSAKEAWCVDIGYEIDWDSHNSSKSLYFRRQVGSINADLVLLMDVLEHVEDDVGLLKEYMEKVSSGTLFLITVPAFSFLWSSHDIFLEHKRRYRLKQLEQVVKKSGLKVKLGSYYFAAVFPFAIMTRFLNKYLHLRLAQGRSHLSTHHPIVNVVLGAMSDMELPLLPFNRLAGLTIFCLAEKI